MEREELCQYWQKGQVTYIPVQCRYGCFCVLVPMFIFVVIFGGCAHVILFIGQHPVLFCATKAARESLKHLHLGLSPNIEPRLWMHMHAATQPCESGTRGGTHQLLVSAGQLPC